MLTFPVHLFNPASIQLRPAGATITGGESLAGETDTIRTDGGGYWHAQMVGIELLSPDQIRAWRVWEDLLENGTTKVLVPVPDLRQAPRPIAGGRPSRPSNLADGSDDPYFPEAVAFAAPWIVAATVDENRPLRATDITIEVTRGARLRGGEIFAIDHAGAGRRVYRVGRVLERDEQTAKVTVRPPLREAVDIGTAVDFDWPSFVGKLVAEADISPDIRYGTHSTVDILFTEAF